MLFIKYSSIPIFAAMYAVNVTSPAQLPLVSGYWNSGDKKQWPPYIEKIICLKKIPHTEDKASLNLCG